MTMQTEHMQYLRADSFYLMCTVAHECYVGHNLQNRDLTGFMELCFALGKYREAELEVQRRTKKKSGKRLWYYR